MQAVLAQDAVDAVIEVVPQVRGAGQFFLLHQRAAERRLLPGAVRQLVAAHVHGLQRHARLAVQRRHLRHHLLDKRVARFQAGIDHVVGVLLRRLVHRAVVEVIEQVLGRALLARRLHAAVALPSP
jgi:uncharacterized membrane protein